MENEAPKVCDISALPHTENVDRVCSACSLGATFEEYCEAVDLMCLILNICQPKHEDGEYDAMTDELYAVCLGAVRSPEGSGMCGKCEAYCCRGDCEESSASDN